MYDSQVTIRINSPCESIWIDLQVQINHLKMNWIDGPWIHMDKAAGISLLSCVQAESCLVKFSFRHLGVSTSCSFRLGTTTFLLFSLDTWSDDLVSFVGIFCTSLLLFCLTSTCHTSWVEFELCGNSCHKHLEWCNNLMKDHICQISYDADCRTDRKDKTLRMGHVYLLLNNVVLLLKMDQFVPFFQGWKLASDTGGPG